MPSIKYDEIYSKFFARVKAYDILNYENDKLNVFMCDWVRSAINKPHIRRLFTEINNDNEIQVISYKIKYSIDENFDKEFAIDLISIGMIVEWITPAINDYTNIAQLFGTADSKFYSQKNHLDGLKELKTSLIREQKAIIRDRGYMWNSYLHGEA